MAVVVETQIGQQTLIPRNRQTRQASSTAAVVVGLGETLVARRRRRGGKRTIGKDFFLLVVDYFAKVAYAAGKFPGGFIKPRRPTDHQGNPDFPPHRSADLGLSFQTDYSP